MAVSRTVGEPPSASDGPAGNVRHTDAVERQMAFFDWSSTASRHPRSTHSVQMVHHSSVNEQRSDTLLSTNRRVSDVAIVQRHSLGHDSDGSSASDSDDLESLYEASFEKIRELQYRPGTLSVAQVYKAYACGSPRIDAGLLILDTACAMSVSGNLWLADYQEVLESSTHVRCAIFREDEDFSFGNCSPRTSKELWWLPACLDSKCFALSTSSLQGYFPMLCSLLFCTEPKGACACYGALLRIASHCLT